MVWLVIFNNIKAFNLADSFNYKFSKILKSMNNKRVNKFKTFFFAIVVMLFCCYANLLFCYYVIFLNYFHQCLHAIYQTVLIKNLLKYLDLLIIKELINLNHLHYCYYYAIILEKTFNKV